MVEPLRIYLSVDPGQWLSGEVLRYSILRRTKAQVHFQELEPYAPSGEEIPLALSRWSIPTLQNYRGKALFLTANKVVLDDIEKLFLLESDKPALAAAVEHPPGSEGYHTDLMRLDCEKLRSWEPALWLKKGALTPETITALNWGLPESPFYSDLGPLDPLWNQSGPLSPETKIYSFADLKSEPWRNRTHPHRELFLKELKQAVEEEEVSMELLLKEIQRGHVYPKIIEDLVQL